MEKDKTIIDFIEKVSEDAALNDVEVVDYWDSDLCAVGFKKGNKLVYVSTYNYIDNEEVLYDYIIELNKKDGDYSVLKEKTGVQEKEVIKVLKFLCEERK